MVAQHNRPRPAFTLIELLVVIAIIALLVSILLPSLNRAREQARATVCLSNMKQVALAFFIYAHEYRYIPGTFWQGPINLDWCGRDNASYLANPGLYEHPLQTSVLRPYLHSMHKILECPTAKRQANHFFDYTVIIRLAGARTDLRWYMTYPQNPTQPTTTRRRFPGLPFLIEEDSKFYNATYDDGSFANLDQFSDRHNRGCNLAYLDGSVSRFVSPKGPLSPVAEPLDLTANHLRLWARDMQFTVGASSALEFGWANNPQ
ncbi:MAG TPA: DUF1559 domain-containing protein [Phycisphaerae bacterium]|jgi:prepilin-type N-terminal cleavage/methylation domain-containing protein/prepilin-type processing-associated H-X9-DG protein